MERSTIIDRMKSRVTTINDFNYDALSAPPLLSLLTYEDIEYFRNLATSIRYSSKIEYKYSEIDRIMKMRGFRKLGAGTNRVIYRHLEIDTIVIKIAIDDVGVRDNPREYQNQFYLKPYVTKVFEVSPCGTVGLFERCDQIKSREEFMSIASEVYDLLSNWIIGKYIMEDIGTRYFMNYCVRPGFGPVLCDFPYLYELDGNKLYCQIPDENGILCDGVIDYDDGFNHLYCSKCGAKYKAMELKKAITNNLIIEREKENVKMRVMAKLGNNILRGDNNVGTQTNKYERNIQYFDEYETDQQDYNYMRITTTLQQQEEKVVTPVAEEIPALEVEEPVVETVEKEVAETDLPFVEGEIVDEGYAVEEEIDINAIAEEIKKSSYEKNTINLSSANSDYELDTMLDCIEYLIDIGKKQDIIDIYENQNYDDDEDIINLNICMSLEQGHVKNILDTYKPDRIYGADNNNEENIEEQTSQEEETCEEDVDGDYEEGDIDNDEYTEDQTQEETCEEDVDDEEYADEKIPAFTHNPNSKFIPDDNMIPIPVGGAQISDFNKKPKGRTSAKYDKNSDYYKKKNYYKK